MPQAPVQGAAEVNVLLQFLATIFWASVSLRGQAYRRGWLKSRRLKHPVISVGNLSVGGTGKTPLVILIAKTLLAAGRRPCILTRGYGRRGGMGLIALDPDSGLIFDPRAVGDEPALLAQALPNIPIIVARDRFRAGLIAERDFRADVHLLDDGFQHLALARDLDIVLLDVARPISELALLPAGRLREPFSALRRAHWVILTRTELGDAGPLQARVRAENSRARVFHCSTKLTGLVEPRGGAPVSPENLLHKPVGAFCGIGNPAAFLADLRRWGLRPAAERVFPDHHEYTARELESVVASSRNAGAEALLTTEKDLMNLPPEWKAPMPLLACRISSEIEEKVEFERALLDTLGAAGRAT